MTPHHQSGASWRAQTEALTLHLVKHLTVTNTLGEFTGAAVIRDLLSAMPYFQEHPEHLKVVPVAGDPLGRANVVALVKGIGDAAVVLSGHYDVVSVENYGALQDFANHPVELLPRLVRELQSSHQSEADSRALRDLLSGDFLPGRGALDMKSGLAAGIAVLQYHADKAPEERNGSVIFLATPDEEDRSRGMRDIAPKLPTLARNWGLNIRAAINLDASGDLTDGSEGQVIFLGSVGKLLLSAFVVGRDTHAGYPFDGVNANFLVSSITRAMECSTTFCDVAEGGGGAISPPPTTLKQQDLKVGYDVTTPVAAWACYNALTLSAVPEDVLARFRNVVTVAVDDAMKHLAVEAAVFAQRRGVPDTFSCDRVRVMTFAELQEVARVQGGEQVLLQARSLASRSAVKDQADLPAVSRDVTEFLWQATGLHGPTVIVGFASLPYPAVALDEQVPEEARLLRIVAQLSEESVERFGVRIGVRGFFQGISDMSFLGRVRLASLQFIAEQTPSWGSAFKWKLTAEATPGLPTINVGPWGRDYHQRLERVHTPYSFEVLPEVIAVLATRVLAES